MSRKILFVDYKKILTFSVLCILTSFPVLRAPKSWLKYFFSAVFNLFFVHFKPFSVISCLKSPKNVWMFSTGRCPPRRWPGRRPDWGFLLVDGRCEADVFIKPACTRKLAEIDNNSACLIANQDLHSFSNNRIFCLWIKSRKDCCKTHTLNPRLATFLCSQKTFYKPAVVAERFSVCQIQVDIH